MAFINGKKVLSVVKIIPSGITPTGTKDITTNGEHDVSEYEKVNVNVPIPSGYVKPNGTFYVTSNGTHNVNNYEKVNVNVSNAKPEQEKSVTPTKAIQEVTPDSGYALRKVTVGAIPSNYVEPNGTLNVVVNGSYYVGNYANLNVNVDNRLPEQEKSVTPTKTTQVVTPDNGYTLNKVTVEPIPSEYIRPKGTQEITTNGMHYIQEYAAVNVNVVFDQSSLIFAYYGEGV